MVAGRDFQEVHAHMTGLGFSIRSAKVARDGTGKGVVLYRPDGAPVAPSLDRVFKGLTDAVQAVYALHPAPSPAPTDGAVLAADIAAHGAAGKPLPRTAGQASHMLEHMAFMVGAADSDTRAAFLVALFGRARGSLIWSAMEGGAGLLDAVWNTHPPD